MNSKAAMVSEVVDDIRRIFQVLTEQSKKIEHETNLSGPQLWTIKILNDSPVPMTASELGKRMYLHPATMVGLLDRLEAKGLITRNRSEKDRRCILIGLTARSRDILENAPEVAQGMLVKGLEQLSEHKLKHTADGINQVVKILGVESDLPKLIMSTEINFPKRKKKP